MRPFGFLVLSIVLAAYAAEAGGCGPGQPPPLPATWASYSNRWYGYAIRYPPESSIVETIGGSSTTVYLLAGNQPFATSEPLVLLTATHPGANCVIPGTRREREARPTLIRVGAVVFARYSGQSGAPSAITTWESYSTEQDGTCVVITYSVRPLGPSLTDSAQAVHPGDEARSHLDGILASFTWVESD